MFTDGLGDFHAGIVLSPISANPEMKKRRVNKLDQTQWAGKGIDFFLYVYCKTKNSKKYHYKNPSSYF